MHNSSGTKRASVTLAAATSSSVYPQMGWWRMCVTECEIVQLLSKVEQEPISYPSPLLHALTHTPVRPFEHAVPGHRGCPA